MTDRSMYSSAYVPAASYYKVSPRSFWSTSIACCAFAFPMRQLVKPGASKGDSSVRSRRPVVGAPKPKEKPAAHRRLCFAAVLAVTFFL